MVNDFFGFVLEQILPIIARVVSEAGVMKRVGGCRFIRDKDSLARPRSPCREKLSLSLSLLKAFWVANCVTLNGAVSGNPSASCFLSPGDTQRTWFKSQAHTLSFPREDPLSTSTSCASVPPLIGLPPGEIFHYSQVRDRDGERRTSNNLAACFRFTCWLSRANRVFNTFCVCLSAGRRSR